MMNNEEAFALAYEKKIRLKKHAMKYKCMNMQDIADHFDGHAESHARASENATTAKAKQSHKAMSVTWSAAARFIELCEF